MNTHGTMPAADEANSEMPKLEGFGVTESTTSGTPARAAALLNGFDLANLRLTSITEKSVKAVQVLTAVPITRPKNDMFFRSHPDQQYWQTLLTIEIRTDNDFFVVSPALYDALVGEPLVKPRILVPYVTAQGNVFLWPMRLADQDGRLDDYNRSAIEHAERARDAWVRIAANRQRGAYDRWEATGNIGEPKFPNLTPNELYALGLKDRVISDLDHPLLKKLRGEI